MMSPIGAPVALAEGRDGEEFAVGVAGHYEIDSTLNDQVPERAGHRAGFSVTGGREAKAAKIRAVIELVRGPLTSTDRILDVGAGSGGIAATLGVHATLYATDNTDQRIEKANYSFVLADENLPFPDGTFDVVVSNHVIEHVGNAARHLSEIRRVIKSSGVCYLATPNRWWPFEVHSRLVALHWLPTSWFQFVAKLLGRLPESVSLLSLPALAQRSRADFKMEVLHDKIVLDAARFALDLPRWARLLIGALPPGVIAWSRNLQPTLIVVLRPRPCKGAVIASPDSLDSEEAHDAA